MFVTIALVLGFVYLLYLYVTWNYDYWQKRNLAGPKPKFLVGNFPSVLTRGESQTYENERLYRQYKDEHPFIGVFSMRSPQILLISPEAIKEVMVKSFKNFHDNEFSDLVNKESDPLLARNPFLLTGEAWKEKRAEITPGFSNNRIKALYPLMEEVCGKMVAYTKQMNEKNPKDGIDTRELAAKFTTDVVASCVFAMDAESFTKEKPQIREVGKRMMDPNLKTVILLMLHAVFPFLKNFLKSTFITKDIENFFLDLMHKALRYRKDNNITRADYLDHLIQMKDKKNLSELDLAAHTVTFFIDGFDTSSVFIAHALYLLAANRDVQEKLRLEIDQKIAENGAITYDTLVEMPYLDQVANEALRMYPPGSFVTRKCTEPIELVAAKDKKIKIDNQLNLIIPIYSIHHDEEYYKNPEKFDPDRFSPENGGIKSYRDKGVYLPFGDGPRICLGMRFALCQSKAAIVEIIRNFDLTVNEKTKLPLIFDPKEFILMPEGGYWINYKPFKK